MGAIFLTRYQSKCKERANKACSGQVGIRRVFGLFSTPEQSPAIEVLSTPAPPATNASR
jgi:hypothetical protein